MYCILIPLLVGLISALLGYLLGRMSSKNNESRNDIKAELEFCQKRVKDYQLEINDLKATNKNAFAATSNANFDGLKADLDACMQKNAGLLLEIEGLKSKSQVSGFATIPFDADAAFAIFGKKVKQDDLKIVEGIGPKIEELFHNAGIKTWKELGETAIEKCQQILDNAGEHYQIHNPATWPKQSWLAYEGKWEELKQWQDQLDGGKE